MVLLLQCYELIVHLLINPNDFFAVLDYLVVLNLVLLPLLAALLLLLGSLLPVPREGLAGLAVLLLLGCIFLGFRSLFRAFAARSLLAFTLSLALGALRTPLAGGPPLGGLALRFLGLGLEVFLFALRLVGNINLKKLLDSPLRVLHKVDECLLLYHLPTLVFTSALGGL